MNFELTDSLIWIIIAVVSGVIEALTLGITTIWFVFGAIAAWIVAEFNLPFIVQILAFIIVSATLLYFTKPLVKRYLKVGRQRTNADALIGDIAIVTESIDTLKSIGQVEVRGQVWSAKTTGELINRGERVEILDIQGVKLLVKRVDII